MHKNNKLALWVASLRAPCFVNSQELATKLDGRMMSYTNDVASVHVAKLTTDKGTISDMDGFFLFPQPLAIPWFFLRYSSKKRK